MTLEKNMLVPLTITGLAAEGNGVGRVRSTPDDMGMVVFVPFTAEGDEITCRIVKVTKHYAFGIVEKLLKPSPLRETAAEGDVCSVYTKCGGCALRHLSYEAECRAKQQQVQDALQRIGGFSLPVEPIVGSKQPDRYRNKALYPVASVGDRLVAGFFAPRSHRLVEQTDCRLQPAEFRPLLEAVLQWGQECGVTAYDELKHTGLLRHVFLRKAESTGQIMVCVVTTSGKIPDPDRLITLVRQADSHVVSIAVNLNRERTNVVLGRKSFPLYGEPSIDDELCGLKFRLSAPSFYQVNHAQAERLYALAGKAAGLTGTETVLDVYCGTGTIGLTMAKEAGQIIGIEIVKEAVEDARQNAERNGIANARYLCADAAKAAAQLKQEDVKPDVVILDPPRKGCDEPLLETVVGMQPERIVYVSCNPATLARDCRMLAANGYELRKATPVDMFPRTAHVETVVSLSRKNPDDVIHVDLDLTDMPLTKAESTATYTQIKAYVLEHSGLKVSSLYISQVKRKLGLEVGAHYNLPKSEESKQPQCPADKEKAIIEALKHFKMIG